ncbi:hypothetical protein [Streptomyces hokutonensis]|uniref:hypothetical protein n=1 Tax=Streptomyces hokutonensis TaxID=1306990 RepID=UPI003809A1E9
MGIETAEIAGHISLRPVRVGLVFEPTLDALVKSIKLATTAWGGMYFPFIDPTRESPLSLAVELDVDVLYAVDNSAESDQLSRSMGYKWQGGAEWGPFGNQVGYASGHIQSIDWLIGETLNGPQFTYYQWEDESPLKSVLLALHGDYSDDAVGELAKTAFRAKSRTCTLGRGELVARTSEIEEVSPIQLTGREISYRGEAYGSGVVVIRPEEAGDIAQFWNLRASGLHVHPWVVGHDTTSRSSFVGWLNRVLQRRLIPNSKRGDGVDLGPVISIHMPDGMDVIPAMLEAELQTRDIAFRVTNGGDFTHGWRGRHPFHTEFGEFFSSESSRGRVFNVPMPNLDGARWRRGHEPGFLIADISVDSVTGLAPDMVVSMPAARELSPLVDTRDFVTQRIHRVTDDGRAVAVRADEKNVAIRAVSAMAAIETLMSGAGWKFQQTGNGKFSTRLIEKLGGSFSYVANQPSIRTALMKASASHAGLPFTALMSHAKRHRGAWPDSLSSIPHDEYPARIIRYLLARKALQPVLPIRCPECTVEMTVSPEDLRSECSCELCGSQFPLGLALGMHARNDWSYKIAGNIAPDRLGETLPVMATVSILSGYRSTSANHPYALGVAVDSPHGKFEVDIVMALAESYPPLLVIGEVKSYMDPVTAEDLEHLRLLQNHLRANNVDCYVLVATLRDELPDETLNALRSFCEDTPASFGSRVLPILPIVLTGRNLSVPQFHDDNPWKWQNPGTRLSDLALESCRRNIGLLDVAHQWIGQEWKFVPTWRVQ